MKVYRLSKRKYSNELNGKGAAKFGNRWNSKGVEMIYTAESRARAMAEVAVHLALATLPSDFEMIEIEVPNNIKVNKLNLEELNENWNINPPILSTQKIGDKFIDSSDSCILKVPSAVVQGDYDYLINSHHPEFNEIKIIDVVIFPFDKRIFK